MKTLIALLVCVALAACGAPQGGDAGPGPTAERPAAAPVSASPSRTEPSTGTASSAATPSGSPTSSASSSVPVSAKLDFTGTTVEGKAFRGAGLAGTPVLFWFWAPWCPTCRSQISQVQDLADRYGSDLAVVGVGSLDSADAIRGFAGGTRGVTQLSDPDGRLWRHFSIAEQSSYVLLDASGAVVLKSGYGGSAELEKRVADVVR